MGIGAGVVLLFLATASLGANANTDSNDGKWSLLLAIVFCSSSGISVFLFEGISINIVFLLSNNCCRSSISSFGLKRILQLVLGPPHSLPALVFYCNCKDAIFGTHCWIPEILGLDKNRRPLCGGVPTRLIGGTRNSGMQYYAFPTTSFDSFLAGIFGLFEFFFLKRYSESVFSLP